MRLIGVRYSLRTMLIVMTVGPATGYWFGLPTLTAYRYVSALKAKDYRAADRMCVDREHPFPGDAQGWFSFMGQVRLEPWNWRDIWRGERRLKIYYEAHMGSRVMSFAGLNAVATRSGIEFPNR